jgi:putative copper export protein
MATAAIFEDWSRIARPVVALLIASGGLLAALMIRRLDLVYATHYGTALTAKLLFVLTMLVLAARHAFVLVPAAARGEPGAGARLARSIRFEAAVALLVFWAAAEMVSIHPLDAGHRVTG